MTTLGELGEDAVVDLIAGRLISPPSLGENLGHPDDARDMLPRGPRIIYSMDAYRVRSLMLPWRTWRDIGWMALTGAVSDIVSKGGLPSVAMVGLGLSRDASIEEVEELATGLREAGEHYGVRITGGDTNEGGDPWIAVSVIGFTTCKRPPSRRGAKPGDTVVVTGLYGGMGFVALHGVEKAGELEWVVKASRRTSVRVEVAHVIMSTYRFIHASMDVSDGLGYTLQHISALSGHGIALKKPPLHPPELDEYCRGETSCIWRHVLAGGEEYGVVLVVDGGGLSTVVKELEYYGVPYTVVGEVVESPPGIYIDGVKASPPRWDQFKGW
ncbi:thiamine-phosphate kinase [Desulfurococcus mucosus]|uniref:Thiamine-monophosphate kinase n=1 Tax=Desulfurococcus mucosus (strain ATCC 35584 / DSM 2162 / JCM 9187 / O7/1) TaxID=765177 RepID=E8R8T8_DESM0|nr:thiamine-phosphate kinase [Desulfurococcus mucosus]ADV64914.1 Thiamine-phosphate kinase [Desulfurococcus mucosus DSM 2162]